MTTIKRTEQDCLDLQLSFQGLVFLQGASYALMHTLFEQYCNRINIPGSKASTLYSVTGDPVVNVLLRVTEGWVK